VCLFSFLLYHEQIPSLLGKQRKHFACGYCPFLFNFLSTPCSVIKMAVGRRSKLNCSRNVYLKVWRWEYFSTPCWCSVRTTPKVLLFGCWSITLFVYGIWIESWFFFSVQAMIYAHQPLQNNAYSFFVICIIVSLVMLRVCGLPTFSTLVRTFGPIGWCMKLNMVNHIEMWQQKVIFYNGIKTTTSSSRHDLFWKS
jgi:hypothetical protein